MANDVNKIFISGRLVRNIDLRQCDSGKSVADFVIASNRKKVSKDDPKRNMYVTFVKVTLWNDDADYWAGNKNIEALQIGDEVLVEGQLFDDDFVSKNTQTKTNGRLRVDNASVKLLKRADVAKNDWNNETDLVTLEY